MEAHFIIVNNSDIFKTRAAKRESIGGHSSETTSIEKTYQQAYRNFIAYLPKLRKATVWDNSEEYGISKMQPQFVYENGVLAYQNPSITAFAKSLLDYTKNFKNENSLLP